MRKIPARALFIFALTMLQSIVAFAGADPCRECRIATDQELAEIRGGYNIGGVDVSFGVEKTVWINGIVQAVNTLNLPQLASVSGQLNGSLGNLIQSGANNAVAASALNALRPGLSTVVQNSLDGTLIHNLTRIDASVNVLGLYRDMNLGSMVNQQVINSMR